MASEACALVFGRVCYGLAAGGGGATRPTQFLGAPRLLRVSCKSRNKNLSSQHKRQQRKKASPEQLPLNMKLQSNNDEISDVQKGFADSVLDSDQEALPRADADTDAVTKIDGASVEENTIVIENLEDGQQLSSVCMEDLIEMTRNAEKNILLLNEARVRALEDVDKVLSEKEVLQAEINNLGTRLAETDARIKVAAQDKVHVEILESQLENLRSEFSSGSITEEVKHVDHKDETKHWNLDSLSADSNGSPLSGLSALRRENMLLKADIQILKSKLIDGKVAEERVLVLEKERSMLEGSVRELESRLRVAQADVSELASTKSECKALCEKVENLQALLSNKTKQANQAIAILQQNNDLQKKVDKLEASLQEANAYISSLDKSQEYNEIVEQKVKTLDERLQVSDQEIHSHIKLYQESAREFQETLDKLKEESKRRSLETSVDDMPSEFWSRLLLLIDGWLLEKKISSDDAKLLRNMAWKKDHQIRDAYLACKGNNENEALTSFLKLTLSQTSSGLHVIHIAAEMAPVAKVGGLGDVVSGLSKALQRKGHIVEIILPKYDCMQHDCITDLKALDTVVHSYFDGQLFENKIWTGIVEGLPVYFVEPHHPAKYFWRGQVYGESDDFKRFSYFSRAALELLHQAGKKPDIIHCHDWQTAFVAPLYWDIYASRGFDSARICFTCHNFEYQGIASASELASCGLDVHNLNRPDRMRDNSAHDRINPVKGGIVYSNIVTTVSPTYGQEVLTVEGGRGLHNTLNAHSRKFVGILNGIDTDVWNPSTDTFIGCQYNADDLEGKALNKDALRKLLKMSSVNAFQPLVGCITRLVPQKGVHLIRHAIYRTLELGGQFVLLGSSPVPHIQREFENISNHFQNHPHVRMVLKYDDALSHSIYAASDIFIIPSIFEPCGLTQMIAMRYGSVPVVRRTGGLNDSVFDVDDETIPVQFRNGFTFLTPNEQELSSVMERAFNYYMKSPESWKGFVQKVMRLDFGWDSSAEQYEELYQKSVARARAVNRG